MSRDRGLLPLGPVFTRCASCARPAHAAPAGRFPVSRRVSTADCAQYARTTRTSSSVTSPSVIRKERNWNSPAPSVSAVETRT